MAKRVWKLDSKHHYALVSAPHEQEIQIPLNLYSIPWDAKKQGDQLDRPENAKVKALAERLVRLLNQDEVAVELERRNG